MRATLVGFIGVLLFGSGCLQTCDELCAQEARYIDGCLETWQALWPDFGYDGVRDVDEEGLAAGTTYDGGPTEEYVKRCQQRHASALYFSHPEAARTLRVNCATNLQVLAGSQGCAQYLPQTVNGLRGQELDPTEGDNGVAPRPADD